ncbi:MAG: hypothetical protein ACOCXS_01690 [Bacteroidota bacterium]
MAENIRIETFGSIAKEENLTTLKEHALPNTLVLESEAPFPGYHGSNLPTDSVPNWLYFITAKKHSIEKVIRSTQEIKRYLPFTFDASSAQVCIYNITYPCVRIRGLQSFDQVSTLQSSYLDVDVTFAKRKLINAPGIIEVKKLFSLTQLSDHVFQDNEDRMMFYLKIPYQLKWRMFAEVGRQVKNNVDNANFDAALGAIYLKGVMDVIRIYTKNSSAERLEMIRDKFLAEIKRVI